MEPLTRGFLKGFQSIKDAEYWICSAEQEVVGACWTADVAAKEKRPAAVDVCRAAAVAARQICEQGGRPRPGCTHSAGGRASGADPGFLFHTAFLLWRTAAAPLSCSIPLLLLCHAGPAGQGILCHAAAAAANSKWGGRGGLAASGPQAAHSEHNYELNYCIAVLPSCRLGEQCATGRKKDRLYIQELVAKDVDVPVI
eukprot:1158166-Pelagomonas_calceolata.AAC.12